MAGKQFGEKDERSNPQQQQGNLGQKEAGQEKKKDQDLKLHGRDDARDEQVARR